MRQPAFVDVSAIEASDVGGAAYALEAHGNGQRLERKMHCSTVRALKTSLAGYGGAETLPRQATSCGRLAGAVSKFAIARAE